jgi:hypothetical protein
MQERVIKDLPIRSGRFFGLVTFGQRVLRFGFLSYQKAFFILFLCNEVEVIRGALLCQQGAESERGLRGAYKYMHCTAPVRGTFGSWLSRE